MSEEENLERFVSDGNYEFSYHDKRDKDAVNELVEQKKREQAAAYEKYIPLGSIVSLEDSQKLMVIGYNAVVDDDNYDYIGCEFPYGIDHDHQAIFFNHDRISKFFSIGFVNDQGNYYRSQLASDGFGETVQKM